MCKSLHGLKKSFGLALVLLASLGTSAQTEISTAEGLKAMANDLTGEYVLTSDITLSEEWTPIGNAQNPFCGTFNGQGHTINGLRIGGGENLGLFGTASGAIIENVRLTNAEVGQYGNGKAVGTIVGNAQGVTIKGCFTSGVAYGNDHVGGIAGDVRNGTEIINCLSTMAVYSSGYQAGGIAGDNYDGSYTNNLFLGQVYAGNSWNGCGAIVGLQEGPGSCTVNGCVAAPVSLGVADGVANYHIHAIVGNNDPDPKSVLNNCLVLEPTRYYVGSIRTGADITGGKLDTIKQSQYNGIPKTEAELKQKATYTAIGWNEQAWDMADGRFPVLQGMSVPFDGDYVVYNSLPEFFKGTSVDLAPFSTLDRQVTISSSNPNVIAVDGTKITAAAIGQAVVTISTEGDALIKGFSKSIDITVNSMDTDIKNADELLTKLKQNPSGEFDIVADIDLTGVEFTPLPEFTGKLHGNGHVIRGMRFDNSGQANVGLFSTTRSALIEDLGFEDAYLVGNENVGAVAGHVYGGIVRRIFVMNSYIEGRDHVGSFTGDMSNDFGALSEISDCISDAQVKTRQYQSGGMVGVANGGVLKNCLFSGTAEDLLNYTCNNGFISLIDSETYPTTITNCFSGAAHINGGDPNTPRIAQSKRNNTVLTNNYVMASTVCNGSFSTVSGSADNEQGAMIDDNTARTKAFYANTLGWDFENTWTFLPNAEGKMFPVLKIMKTPLKTRIIDDEFNSALVYEAGSEFKDLTKVHASWGQALDIKITEGENLVDVVEGTKLYCSDEDGVFLGMGTLTIQANMPSGLAELFTVVGENSFSIPVTANDIVTEISTVEDLKNMKKMPSGKFVLTADIDMKDVEFEGLFNDGNAFSGTFDGQGHRIKNATVNVASGDNKGIFGNVNGGIIKNVAFEDFQVISPNKSANHIGFIGRAENCTIENVALTGKVMGNDHVALLAGDGVNATVENCYVWGEVTANQQIGGIFGCTLDKGATIRNTYYNGKMDAVFRGCAGGFIGLVDVANSEITIEGCVSIGDIWSSSNNWSHAGSFIGKNGAGDTPNGKITFTNNIANQYQDLVGVPENPWPFSNETAEGGFVEYQTDVPTQMLEEQSTYTNIGWDFENIWTFDTNSGYKYPVLKNIGYVPFTLSEENNNPDGIVELNGQQTTVAKKHIYDLNGRQMKGNLKKGVYVVNGNKVVIK